MTAAPEGMTLVPTQALRTVLAAPTGVGYFDEMRARKQLLDCLPPVYTDEQCEAFRLDILGMNYGGGVVGDAVDGDAVDVREGRKLLNRLHAAGWKVVPPEAVRDGSGATQETNDE